MAREATTDQHKNSAQEKADTLEKQLLPAKTIDERTTRQRLDREVSTRFNTQVKYEGLQYYLQLLEEETERESNRLKEERDLKIGTFKRQLSAVRVWALRTLTLRASIAQWDEGLSKSFPMPATPMEFIKKHSAGDTFLEKEMKKWIPKLAKTLEEFTSEQIKNFDFNMTKLQLQSHSQMKKLIAQVGEEEARKYYLIAGLSEAYNKVTALLKEVKAKGRGKSDREQDQILKKAIEQMSGEQELRIQLTPTGTNLAVAALKTQYHEKSERGEVGMDVDEDEEGRELLYTRKQSRKRTREEEEDEEDEEEDDDEDDEDDEDEDDDDDDDEDDDEEEVVASGKRRMTRSLASKPTRNVLTNDEVQRHFSKYMIPREAPDDGMDWRRIPDPGQTREEQLPVKIVNMEKKDIAELPSKKIRFKSKASKSKKGGVQVNDPGTVIEKRQSWTKTPTAEKLATLDRTCPDDKCREQLKADQVDAHISTEHNVSIHKDVTPVYACYVCKKMFVKLPHRANHQREHFPYPSTYYCASLTCQKYDCLFNSKQEFHRHQAKFHAVKDLEKCFFCDMTTDNHDKLLRHQKLGAKSSGEGKCMVKFDPKFIETEAICLECPPKKKRGEKGGMPEPSVTFTTKEQKLEHYNRYHRTSRVGDIVTGKKKKKKKKSEEPAAKKSKTTATGKKNTTQESIYRCVRCGASFTTCNKLIAHLNKKHPSEDDANVEVGKTKKKRATHD